MDCLPPVERELLVGGLLAVCASVGFLVTVATVVIWREFRDDRR